MDHEEHQIPIWFFIGGLLAIYGILIFASGVASWVHPPMEKVRLWDYHADVWWGLLMMIVGSIYTYRFNPWAK
jgi:hypothetical protein